VVICLKRGADLHMAQLMPLPVTVSCFSKIQIGFAFLVPAHPGSPGQRAVKRVCVCVCSAFLWVSTFVVLKNGIKIQARSRTAFLLNYGEKHCSNIYSTAAVNATVS